MRLRRAAGTFLLIAGVLALAACSAAQSASDTSAESFGLDTTELSQPVPFDGGDAVSGDLDSSGLPVEESTSERAVVTAGSVSLTADDPIAAAADAVRLVDDVGGRIDRRDEQPTSDDGAQDARADLVVRIPSTALTATLAAIENLGEVRQVQLNETDVTVQTQDVAARISALVASTDRLSTLLASAASTDDLLAIETTLSERQEQLESLQAQQRGLTDQVQFATISVAIGSAASAPEETPDTFASGLVTGWQSLVAAIGALLVGFGVALPWLVVALIAVVAVLLIRRSRATGESAPTTGSATTTMEE